MVSRSETASHIVHTATKMCVLRAITKKVDPAKVLGVIEMFKAGRPFKRCSGIKKTPGIKRDLRPK
jgi:hypothetical protein